MFILSTNTQLRSKNNFLLPFLASNMAERQSVYQISFHWNQMPSDLKKIANIRAFKKELKKYLIDSMKSF